MESKKTPKKVKFEDLKLKSITSLKTAWSMDTQSGCSMTDFQSVVSDVDSVTTDVWEPLLP